MDTNGIMPTMNVGGDGFGGNSAIWLFALLILFGMGGFGGGWSNNGTRVGEAYATQADIQRAVDLDTLKSGQSNIVSAIKDASYNNLGEMRDIQSQVDAGFSNMQNCCCNILRSIDGVNYNGALNTASINANTTAVGQKILDAIQQNKFEAMQNEINSLRLAQAMNGVVKYPLATTYCSGSNPFASCNCNGNY